MTKFLKACVVLLCAGYPLASLAECSGPEFRPEVLLGRKFKSLKLGKLEQVGGKLNGERVWRVGVRFLELSDKFTFEKAYIRTYRGVIDEIELVGSVDGGVDLNELQTWLDGCYGRVSDVCWIDSVGGYFLRDIAGSTAAIFVGNGKFSHPARRQNPMACRVGRRSQV